MGYRGKIHEREEARRLRGMGWTLHDIARALHVSKSSVSIWVRDVEFTPRPRRNRNHGSRRRPPNALERAKHDEIEFLCREGFARIGTLSDVAFLAAGAALYAGEGGKSDGPVRFANTNPEIVRFFMTWLRRFFTIDESRLRARLNLHEGLDLDAATRHWSAITGIPPEQFGRPYRAVPDPSIRRSKHPMGCLTVDYGSKTTHRGIMGLVHPLLTSGAIPG